MNPTNNQNPSQVPGPPQQPYQAQSPASLPQDQTQPFVPQLQQQPEAEAPVAEPVQLQPLAQTPPTPQSVQPMSPPQPVQLEPTPMASEPPAEPEAVQAAPDPDAPKKKILLVEDDSALASVYTTRLQAEGFDVHLVNNGEDALAAALNYKPDLVLLDVMMPKVSGFDVLDILRNTPETANLKIVMLTALSQDADRQKAESLGVDAYLVKSQVVITDVMSHIKTILGIRQALL